MQNRAATHDPQESISNICAPWRKNPREKQKNSLGIEKSWSGLDHACHEGEMDDDFLQIYYMETKKLVARKQQNRVRV